MRYSGTAAHNTRVFQLDPTIPGLWNSGLIRPRAVWRSVCAARVLVRCDWLAPAQIIELSERAKWKGQEGRARQGCLVPPLFCFGKVYTPSILQHLRNNGIFSLGHNLHANVQGMTMK